MGKITITTVQEYCKTNGIKCLEENYINAQTKMKFECSCGSIFYRTFSKLKQGYIKCQQCSGRVVWDIESIKNYVEEKGLELLSEEYRGAKYALKFRCKCGTEFERSWNNFYSKKTHCCPNCSRVEVAESQKLDFTVIEEFCRDNNMEVLSKKEDYKNSSTKLLFKCSCGKTFERNWSDMGHNQPCCPTCSRKQSKGERIIGEILNNNGVNFKQEYKIEGCKLIFPLPFDFAIFDDKNNLTFLIEYDGAQHFREAGFGRNEKQRKEDFAKIVIRDAIKNSYCEDNNIFLLRIPFFKENETEEIVLNCLIDYKIIPS